MKIKNILLAGLVLVLGTGLAFAQPRERDHERMFEKLNLNETQKSQLKEIHQNHRKQGESLRKDLKSAHEALRQELKKETPDTAKINQIKEQMKTLEAGLLDLRIDSMIQTRKILSAEQFEKMSQKWKAHHERKFNR